MTVSALFIFISALLVKCVLLFPSECRMRRQEKKKASRNMEAQLGEDSSFGRLRAGDGGCYRLILPAGVFNPASVYYFLLIF